MISVLVTLMEEQMPELETHFQEGTNLSCISILVTYLSRSDWDSSSWDSLSLLGLSCERIEDRKDKTMLEKEGLYPGYSSQQLIIRSYNKERQLHGFSNLFPSRRNSIKA